MATLTTTTTPAPVRTGNRHDRAIHAGCESSGLHLADNPDLAFGSGDRMVAVSLNRREGAGEIRDKEGN